MSASESSVVFCWPTAENRPTPSGQLRSEFLDTQRETYDEAEKRDELGLDRFLPDAAGQQRLPLRGVTERECLTTRMRRNQYGTHPSHASSATMPASWADWHSRICWQVNSTHRQPSNDLQPGTTHFTPRRRTSSACSSMAGRARWICSIPSRARTSIHGQPYPAGDLEIALRRSRPATCSARRSSSPRHGQCGMELCEVAAAHGRHRRRPHARSLDEHRERRPRSRPCG